MVAATGIGSGLDIEGLVTQLVNAERVPPETRLTNREAELTSELSAFGTLQGALSNFQSSVRNLTNASTFDQRSGSSSNSDAVTATVESNAAVGTFNVNVDQLAAAQSLASESFSSASEEVGEGTLTFRFGTVTATPETSTPQTFDNFELNADRSTATVTIDSSNNTLEGVRNAINEADIGVSAAIVNDGTGFRLLLSSEESGAANALELRVDDTGDGIDSDASGLSRLAFNEDANNLSQTVAATDANFTVNGLSLTSASNTVEEVIDGISLTLRETTDAPVQITATQNEGAVRSAIESFVSSYNNVVNVTNNLTSYDAETNVAGPLQGDFSARSIVTQIRNAISEGANGFGGPFSSLSELGITTQADGTLSIDDADLNAALRDNFESIRGVFAEFGATTDAGVQFNGGSTATQVGSYEVVVTQLATRGILQGSSITEPTVPSPLTIDGDNDSLEITVDGVASGTISLTQGTYDSGDALAAELQSRINGDSNLTSAGVSVSVSFSGDNRLEITSSRYGSASNVEITSVGTTSAATLGLAVGQGVDGVDVAGTIGGVAATGSGQSLRASDDSDAAGINLTITGGNLGSRGNIEFSTGVAVGLNGLLENFLSSDGLINLRTTGIQESVDRIGDDREALELRLDALEARYRAQFNALDSLLANLQSTGDFLLTQLESIPLPGNRDN
ncbi:MAG: flagellar filament capping protein FliD [Pseudomonadota bacterium]